MRRCVDSPMYRTPVAVFSLDDLLSRLNIEHGALPLFLVDPGPGPDRSLEVAQDQRAIQRFVAALSARDRAIVHRLFWADETQTSVAADLGVSKMAISKAMARIARRARLALRACRTP